MDRPGEGHLEIEAEMRGEAAAHMILDGIVARVTLGTMTAPFLHSLNGVLRGAGVEPTYLPLGDAATIYIGSEGV